MSGLAPPVPQSPDQIVAGAAHETDLRPRSWTSPSSIFRDIDPEMVRLLADEARRRNAYQLRELDAPRRYSLMACFFVDSRRTILDQLAQMHDQYLQGMERRAENGLKKRRVEYAGKRYCLHTPTPCVRRSGGSWTCLDRRQPRASAHVIPNGTYHFRHLGDISNVTPFPGR